MGPGWQGSNREQLRAQFLSRFRAPVPGEPAPSRGVQTPVISLRSSPIPVSENEVDVGSGGSASVKKVNPSAATQPKLIPTPPAPASTQPKLTPTPPVPAPTLPEPVPARSESALVLPALSPEPNEIEAPFVPVPDESDDEIDLVFGSVTPFFPSRVQVTSPELQTLDVIPSFLQPVPAVPGLPVGVQRAPAVEKAPVAPASEVQRVQFPNLTLQPVPAVPGLPVLDL